MALNTSNRTCAKTVYLNLQEDDGEFYVRVLCDLPKAVSACDKASIGRGQPSASPSSILSSASQKATPRGNNTLTAQAEVDHVDGLWHIKPVLNRRERVHMWTRA